MGILLNSNAPVAIVDPADPSRKAEFDTTFRVPIMIDVDHHKIHKSSSFVVYHAVNGAGFSLCFKVPAGTKRVHIIAGWAVEAAGEMQIWEGRGWDASSGSLITIYNRNRNSANSPILQEDQSTGAFIANDAVILDPTNIGAGANPVGVEIQHREVWSDKRRTENSRGINEFILKNNEIYVITFLSNAGAQGSLIELDWYEHTDE